jgi:hypothetical protein
MPCDHHLFGLLEKHGEDANIQDTKDGYAYLASGATQASACQWATLVSEEAGL